MPMPKIMRPEPGRARAHQVLHIAHRLGQTVEDRARHDRVADVEFDDLRDGGDRLDVVIVEPMSGVDGQARGDAAKLRGGAQPFELARARGARGFGVGAGMQLDHRRARAPRRLDLRVIRIDEQRHADARRAQRRARRRRTRALCPATSRPPSVVTSWRDSGTRQQSWRHDLRAMRIISSVTAISRFMRVCSASRIACTSRSWMWRRSSRRCSVMLSAPASSASSAACNGIGIARAARLAQRRHVIDVDAERDARAAAAVPRSLTARPGEHVVRAAARDGAAPA